jgi:hypothetical protein
MNEGKRNAYRILVGKPEGNGPLREIGWDDMDWIDLAQYRDPCRALVITVMNLRAP